MHRKFDRNVLAAFKIHMSCNIFKDNYVLRSVVLHLGDARRPVAGDVNRP